MRLYGEGLLTVRSRRALGVAMADLLLAAEPGVLAPAGTPLEPVRLAGFVVREDPRLGPDEMRFEAPNGDAVTVYGLSLDTVLHAKRLFDEQDAFRVDD